jgi:hypothetical protein
VVSRWVMQLVFLLVSKHPFWHSMKHLTWHPKTFHPQTKQGLTLSLNGSKRDSTWSTHLGVPSGAPIQFLSLWYVRHKQRTYLASRLAHLQTDSNKLPLEPRHLGVSSGVSKTISAPVVLSAQIVHLYCTDINTVPKPIETRFHMTHVT